MRPFWTDRGLIVSGAAHVALLAATLVAFSSPVRLDDAQESVPVDMITDQAFSQIMKGEKTAKQIKPTPKADKVSEISEVRPTPPVAEAKRDVPLPPPPLKRMEDPGEDDKPEKSEPQKMAALPPPAPPVPTPPVRPQPAKAASKPIEEPEPDDAEVVKPKPVERPKDLVKEPVKEPVKEAAKPVPKPVEKPVESKPALKMDEVAKLLANSKPDPAAKSEKPASKPKSGEESDEPRTKLDLSAISKLLDHDKPQQRGSTGAKIQTASLGAPNASATKMSPSMWDSLASTIADQYQRCWSQSGRSQELHYWPVVRVQLRVDGGLAAAPVLTNPSSDPDKSALGEAAIRAVRMCDPLRIPAQFASYYSEWKSLPINMRTEN